MLVLATMAKVWALVGGLADPLDANATYAPEYPTQQMCEDAKATSRRNLRDAGVTFKRWHWQCLERDPIGR